MVGWVRSQTDRLAGGGGGKTEGKSAVQSVMWVSFPPEEVPVPLLTWIKCVKERIGHMLRAGRKGRPLRRCLCGCELKGEFNSPRDKGTEEKEE